MSVFGLAVSGGIASAATTVCSVNAARVATAGYIDALFTGCGTQGNAGAAVDGYGDASDWVAADGSRYVYASETELGTVVRIDRTANTATVVAGALPASPETEATPGYSGDGGPAVGARLSGPMGLALDRDGDLFIADSANHVVREVDPTGTITTVAGGGTTTAPTAGDGGPANQAVLGTPTGLAVGGGNLFIADATRGDVRAVSLTTGMITTVAGSPTGADGPTTAGPATGTTLKSPSGLAYDGTGDLFVADRVQSRVFEVTAGTIKLVAGNGGYSTSTSAGTLNGSSAVNGYLNDPIGLVADGAGAVYIADSGDDAVRKVTAAGVMTVVAGAPQRTQIPSDGNVGNGEAATATSPAYVRVSYPQGITIDGSGNLYIGGGEGVMAVRQVNGVAGPRVDPGAGGVPFPVLPEAAHSGYLPAAGLAVVAAFVLVGVRRRRTAHRKAAL